MTATKLPIAVGKAVTPGTNDTDGLAKDLGNLYETTDGKMFRVVKCGTAITASANGTIVKTAYSAGVPTWVVSKNTTAKNSAVVGVVPAGITTLAVSQYFLVQVAGPGSVRGASTTVNDGDQLQSNTLGYAASWAATAVGDAGDALRVLGEATNTAALTAAGGLITADLRRVL